MYDSRGIRRSLWNETYDDEVTIENEEGQGWEVRWKNGQTTRDPVLKDGEKVARGKPRAEAVYGPFTLPPSRCRYIEAKRKREEGTSLPFPVHMWASISRSAAPREWLACRLKDPRHGCSDGYSAPHKSTRTTRRTINRTCRHDRYKLVLSNRNFWAYSVRSNFQGNILIYSRAKEWRY